MGRVKSWVVGGGGCRLFITEGFQKALALRERLHLHLHMSFQTPHESAVEQERAHPDPCSCLRSYSQRVQG